MPPTCPQCTLLTCLILSFFTSYVLFFTTFFLPSSLITSKVSIGKHNNLTWVDETLDYDPLHHAHYHHNGKGFKKMIWIIVDALGANVIFNKEKLDTLQQIMPFTSHNFLKQHQRVERESNDHHINTLSLRIASLPPTVTYPSIKTMTMGSIPKYSDMFNNLFADLLELFSNDDIIDHNKRKYHNMLVEDSLLARMKQSGKKIVFYGDETWFSMYKPNDLYFEKRSAPIQGSYILDTVLVDLNVTRDMDNELKQKDQWDVLILHFAGVDHVGHLGMNDFHHEIFKKKLTEMDKVFEKAATNLDPDTLLLISSDHGMNNLGNHGGALSSEMESIALFAFSQKKPLWNIGKGNRDYTSKCYFDQMDLVPSLSLLLGLPQIPTNNLGRIIDPLFPSDELLHAYKQNAMQILQKLILPASSESYSHISKTLCLNDTKIFSTVQLEKIYGSKLDDVIKLKNDFCNKILESTDVSSIGEWMCETRNLLKRNFIFNDWTMSLFGASTMTIISISFYIWYVCDGETPTHLANSLSYWIGIMILSLSISLTQKTGIDSILIAGVTCGFITGICIILSFLYNFSNFTSKITLSAVLEHANVVLLALRYCEKTMILYQGEISAAVLIVLIALHPRFKKKLILLILVIISSIYNSYSLREDEPFSVARLFKSQTVDCMYVLFCAAVISTNLIILVGVKSFEEKRDSWRKHVTLLMSISVIIAVCVRQCPSMSIGNTEESIFIGKICAILLALFFMFCHWSLLEAMEFSLVNALFLMNKYYLSFAILLIVLQTRLITLQWKDSTPYPLIPIMFVSSFQSFHALGYSVSSVASVDFSGAYFASSSFQLPVIVFGIYILFHGPHLFNRVLPLLKQQSYIDQHKHSNDLPMKMLLFDFAVHGIGSAVTAWSVMVHCESDDIWSLYSSTFLVYMFIAMLSQLTTLLVFTLSSFSNVKSKSHQS